MVCIKKDTSPSPSTTMSSPIQQKAQKSYENMKVTKLDIGCNILGGLLSVALLATMTALALLAVHSYGWTLQGAPLITVTLLGMALGGVLSFLSVKWTSEACELRLEYLEAAEEG